MPEAGTRLLHGPPCGGGVPKEKDEWASRRFGLSGFIQKVRTELCAASAPVLVDC